MQQQLSYFTATTKMADIIHANHTLLSVLPRFGITLGFGEKNIDEVCRKHHVDTLFFLIVINIHTFDFYLPQAEQLRAIQMEHLIEYLHKSHQYYVNTKLVSIEQRLLQLKKSCDESHFQMIQRFFDQYKQEVESHFAYEDKTVFPYVSQLMSNTLKGGYHIHQYEENHSNIDDKLNDLTNIIIKYLPDTLASEERNELLMEIFIFEGDLAKHTRMEDKVLIPLVETMEALYEK